MDWESVPNLIGLEGKVLLSSQRIIRNSPILDWGDETAYAPHQRLGERFIDWKLLPPTEPMEWSRGACKIPIAMERINELH